MSNTDLPCKQFLSYQQAYCTTLTHNIDTCYKYLSY